MLKRFRVAERLGTKLNEFGIPIPAVLRRAGLPLDLSEQTRILVSTEELFALWRAIWSVSSDPLIGLGLGVEIRTDRFHPMGIAALSTANFVAAVEHMKPPTCSALKIRIRSVVPFAPGKAYRQVTGENLIAFPL